MFSIGPGASGSSLSEASNFSHAAAGWFASRSARPSENSVCAGVGASGSGCALATPAHSTVTVAKMRTEPSYLITVDLEPGTILLGKYRIQSSLGLGGFGHVVRARHLLADQSVAIKIL